MARWSRLVIAMFLLRCLSGALLGGLAGHVVAAVPSIVPACCPACASRWREARAWRPTPVAAWQDVTVRYPYRPQTSAGPATLAILPGERLLLLGPSGSGKSTLLQTLTGLIPQTVFAEVAGTVTLFGHQVGAPAPSAMGCVRGPALSKSGADAVRNERLRTRLPSRSKSEGLPLPEIDRRVQAALDGVGFPSEQRSRRSMMLSGGEKQIVALAALLARHAPLLVIDEPTAHLAPAAAARLRQLLMAATPATAASFSSIIASTA